MRAAALAPSELAARFEAAEARAATAEERAAAAEERAAAAQERALAAEAQAEALESALGKAERALLELDRVASLSALFASVAHDVRSPLTAIVWNRVILEQRLAKSNLLGDPEIEALLRDDRHACELIEGIFNGMQSFAMSHGEPGPVPMSSVLDTARRLFRWHRLRTRVAFEHVMDGSPSVWGTPGEICQALMSLLVNAAEVSPRGATVRLAVLTRGTHVVLQVTDEGPGLDRDRVEALFVPFRSSKADGLGIGLAVARAMARRHGGDLVVVEREAGAGACFELLLRAC